MPDTATIPVFDIGGVLLDWNPRYLYRKLFDDEAAMEGFLATVCTSDWNRQMDAGKPFAQGVAELTARFPEHAALIAAFHDRWPTRSPSWKNYGHPAARSTRSPTSPPKRSIWSGGAGRSSAGSTASSSPAPNAS